MNICMKSIPLALIMAATLTGSSHGDVLAHYLDGSFSSFNHAGTVSGLDPSFGTQLTFYQGALANVAYTRTNEPINFSDVPGSSGAGQNNWLLFYDYAMPSDRPHEESTYVEFSLKPEEGMALNLESITFDWGAAVQSDVSILSRFAFSIYADIGTGWIPLGPTEQQGLVTVGTEVGFNVFGQSASFDLSSWSQNYQPGEVNFRIAFANTTEMVEESLAISNIRLNGSVVNVPEPSLFLLGLLGAIPAFQRRKSEKEAS